MLKVRLFRIALFLLLVAPFAPLRAQSADPYVPPALSPWVDWVLQRHPELKCATLNDAKICIWPGRLILNVGSEGGYFEFYVRVDRGDLSVPLPGDRRVWPIEVAVGSSATQSSRTPVLVSDEGGQPMAQLPPGEHFISGKFQWRGLPEFISVPLASGLIELNVNGQRISNAQLRNGRELWLQDRSEAPSQESSMQLSVSRRLIDGVPFKISTLVEFRVSGKPRELAIPNFLPTDSTPVNIAGSLTARLDDQKRLVIQLKPGVHRLEITSLLPQPPTSLSAIEVNLPEWPEQEIWAWQTDETFRSVQLTGAPMIDPSQTNIPNEWRSLPAYVITAGGKIDFEQIRRGQKEFAPNQLNLNRHYWLDLDGEGFTVQDSFNGTMNQGWRLDSLGGATLGHISVNGLDQLITLNSETKLPGVEVREQNLSIVAESRIEDRPSTLSAAGWNTDLSSLAVTLSLPPGWSLFAVKGVDFVGHSWLSSWTLFDLFLLALVSLAAGKLLGRRAGIFAFAALLLSHSEDAPYQIWFHLLACVALLKVLPQNRFAKFVRFYYSLATLILLLSLLSFSYVQIKTALYPQLEDRHRGVSRIANFIPQPSTAPEMERLAVGFDGDTAASSPAPLVKQRAYSTKGGYLGEGKADSLSYEKQNLPNLNQVDPKAVVQTGPGVPQWNWRDIQLNWSGPVTPELTFRLFLISPPIEFVLSLLRVFFFIALAGFFLRFFNWNTERIRSIFVSMLLLCLVPTSVSAEELPNQELLQELERRLLQNNCTANCSTLESLQLNIQGDELQITGRVSSKGYGAWAVPGPLEQFIPQSVKVDGESTSALRRTDGQFLWVRLGSGVRYVSVSGKLANRDVLTFQFPQVPGHLSVNAPDWDVDGLSPTGSVGSSLQLSRKVKAAATMRTVDGDSRDAEELLLPEWYSVVRNVSVALPRTISTSVTRLGRADRSTLVKVKLLDGESVTSSEPKVEGRTATVSFPRGANQVTWQSIIKDDVTALSLTAPEKTIDGSDVSESWTLACSTVFRCSISGLSPTSSISDGKQLTSWMPWPGEKVEISITKPEGAEGTATTIDSVHLQYTPGARSTEANLTAQVRTTRGGFERLTLPADAEVFSLRINDREIDIRPDKGVVNLPLSIGSQQVAISWRTPQEFGLKHKAPSVSFESAVYNMSTVIQVPAERWLLLLGGPNWGPAILFWGQVIALALVAFLLGRIHTLPLKSWQWFLLGLGICTTSPAAMLIPLVWFLAHSLHKSKPAGGWFRFNLVQIGLVILTLVFFSALFDSVRNGLMFEPNMQVSGNDSYGSYLKWYQDYSSGELPQPWFISVPMYVYHVLMLVWACWLALSLLHWLRWSWNCFSTDGLWKKRVKKVVTPEVRA